MAKSANDPGPRIEIQRRPGTDPIVRIVTEEADATMAVPREKAKEIAIALLMSLGDRAPPDVRQSAVVEALPIRWVTMRPTEDGGFVIQIDIQGGGHMDFSFPSDPEAKRIFCHNAVSATNVFEAASLKRKG